VQINTEMAEKYSNQRYAVNWQWKICRKYQIFAQNRDFCLPHLYFRRNIATLFGVEKLEWCGYPMVKKIRR